MKYISTPVMVDACKYEGNDGNDRKLISCSGRGVYAYPGDYIVIDHKGNNSVMSSHYFEKTFNEYDLDYIPKSNRYWYQKGYDDGLKSVKKDNK